MFGNMETILESRVPFSVGLVYNLVSLGFCTYTLLKGCIVVYWRYFLVFCMILAGCSLVYGADQTVEDQHKALGLLDKPAARYVPNDHPDAQWFGSGQLGLFLHWGISSINADGEISWKMLANISWNPNPTSPNEYWAQAEEFNPQNYDADKWIKAAKEAGFTYAVLTTRHHDGYAMWPSQYGDLHIGLYTDGVDLVRPFVDACRKHGLKVGLYFSPRNWRMDRGYRSYRSQSDGTPENPHFDADFQPTTVKAEDEEFVRRYRKLNRGQITELLTNYGKIDILWFDGGKAYMTREEIRALQPGILMNNRSEIPADYDASFEGSHLPETRPGGWWEACQTAVGSWAYQTGLDQYATPAADILSTFIKLRAWGGNYLINFAPRADGTMPDVYYQRMKEIGHWMDKYGDSVIGTEGGPYPEQCNVPVTTKGQVWYLHALPEFTQQTIVLAGVPEPMNVKIMASNRYLAYTYDDTRLEIELPAKYRTQMPDVIRVQW